MVMTIERKSPASQARILSEGEELISDKFFRGVRRIIRKEINDHAFAPQEIDLSKLNDKISQAMTIAFLVSSGKIQAPSQGGMEYDFAEGSVPPLDPFGFKFDLPFQEALDLWTKANPAQETLLDTVLGRSGAIADNFSRLLRNTVAEGVTNILTTGKPINVMVRELADEADKGSAYFETALRTSVSTAQNAGHQKRMEGNTNIAILEYRGPMNIRTTGAPGGIYGTKKTRGRNPGHCWDMNDFKAVPAHWIWRKIWPPNHFNCHFKVVSISWARAKRDGYLKADGTVLAKYVNPPIPKFITDGSWPAKGFDQSPMSYLGVAA